VFSETGEDTAESGQDIKIQRDTTIIMKFFVILINLNIS
jgi:hypothetical protein